MEMLLSPNKILDGDVLSPNKIYQGDVLSLNRGRLERIGCFITEGQKFSVNNFRQTDCFFDTILGNIIYLFSTRGQVMHII